MDYKSRITIEPGKRGGKPCIRGLRIAVQDVLEHVASGMSVEEILRDFSYLEAEDIAHALHTRLTWNERPFGSWQRREKQ